MNKKILIASLFATLMLLVPMTSAVGVVSKNVTTDNQPPNPPHINGPSSPKIGINYIYEFCSTDPDGDNISYYIDWDDGTTWGWTTFCDSGKPYSVSHAWYKSGWYLIKCKANDTHGAESNWSYFLFRIPPRNKIVTHNSLFQKFLEQFPILQKILLFQRFGLQ